MSTARYRFGYIIPEDASEPTPPSIPTIGVYVLRFAGRVHTHSHSSIVPLGTLKNNNGVYVFFLFKKAAGRRLASPAAAADTAPDDGDRIIIIATTARVDMHAVRNPRAINGNDEGRGGMMESYGSYQSVCKGGYHI